MVSYQQTSMMEVSSQNIYKELQSSIAPDLNHSNSFQQDIL